LREEPIDGVLPQVDVVPKPLLREEPIDGVLPQVDVVPKPLLRLYEELPGSE
jgi:ASC-1-like (ASCH) protein